MRLPPLSGGFWPSSPLVLAEAFNPDTARAAEDPGRLRQQLEWVPFFFFGYVLMRSKERFRSAFVAPRRDRVGQRRSSAPTRRGSPRLSWPAGARATPNASTAAKRSTARRYSEATAKRWSARRPSARTAASAAASACSRCPGCWRCSRPDGGVDDGSRSCCCLGAMLGDRHRGSARLQVVGAVVALVRFALLSLSAGRRASAPAGGRSWCSWRWRFPSASVLVGRRGQWRSSRVQEHRPGQA